MDSEEIFLKVDVWVRAKLEGDDTREQGLLDPDTGLYNTQGLLRRIGELAAGAVRHSRPLACVVLSAEPGGAAGAAGRAHPVSVTSSRAATWSAEGARSFAATLLSAGRASDTIGRLSATEFVIVAPDTDDDGVLGLAERLRKAVDALAPAPGPLWHVRFGCYAVPDMRDASIAPTEVLIRAAEALRGAEGTRERVRLFSPSPESRN
jgi:GGDEF domain-containing protein